RVVRACASLERSGALRELPPDLRQHVSCDDPDDRVDTVELVCADGRDRHPLILLALDRGLCHLIPPRAWPPPGAGAILASANTLYRDFIAYANRAGTRRRRAPRPARGG